MADGQAAVTTGDKNQTDVRACDWYKYLSLAGGMLGQSLTQTFIRFHCPGTDWRWLLVIRCTVSVPTRLAD